MFNCKFYRGPIDGLTIKLEPRKAQPPFFIFASPPFDRETSDMFKFEYQPHAHYAGYKMTQLANDNITYTYYGNHQPYYNLTPTTPAEEQSPLD